MEPDFRVVSYNAPGTGSKEATVGGEFRDDKLRELIVYVANRSAEDRWFGATKLNKLLYYSDFAAFRQLGAPITGADYMKLPEGPAPREFLRARQSLLADGSIGIESRPLMGYIQQRVVAHRPADQTLFSPDELAVVDEVIDSLGGLTSRQVSDMSHEEPGWKMAADYETIPYATAWLSPEPLTQDQLEHGLKVAGNHELIS